MSKEVYVARADLVLLRYRDEETAYWSKESDPVIDDIEMGLPIAADRIKKGEELTLVRPGDPDWGEYCYGGDESAVLVDAGGMPRVAFYEEGWSGDELFARKEAVQ